MKAKLKNILLYSFITMLGVSSLSVVTFSLAGFERSKRITTTNGGNEGLAIGAEGIRKTEIILNMNSIWNAVDCDIYALAWTNVDAPATVTNFKWFKGTVKDDPKYYSFTIDLSSYDRIQFHRMNTGEDSAFPPTQFGNRNGWGGSEVDEEYIDAGNGASFNRTNDLILGNGDDTTIYRNNSTIYMITGWTQYGNYGFLSPGRWLS